MNVLSTAPIGDQQLRPSDLDLSARSDTFSRCLFGEKHSSADTLLDSLNAFYCDSVSWF